MAEETRPAVGGALTGEGTQELAQEAHITFVPAPAILRPRAEMQAAERLEIGLNNYRGPGKAAAFFEWVKPDGAAREEDSQVLDTVTVDKLVQLLGGPDRLAAALRSMKQEPELTLGPDYGDPQLNFVAMVLAMNRTKVSSGSVRGLR